MGCGQSRIGSIYSKNKKNKNNSKNTSDPLRSASIEQKNGNTKAKTNNNGAELNRNEENGSIIDVKNHKKKSGGPGSGPLLQQAEMSSSQMDFFRMLDEKIENGPDYDESMDAMHRAERISDLLRRWESASQTWSTNVAELDNAPGSLSRRRQLSLKDREGMRNIIGGRLESAPVFTRNANRVDGLQEIQCPSPHMPRHVLESISQSPTQSVKNSTPPGTSTASLRFQEYNREFNTNINSTNEITENRTYQTSSPQLGNQNDDFTNQQALYREEYLQQAGIIAVQSQYHCPNTIRNTNYVQQFQLAPIENNEQHFPGRKRTFNSAQTT